MSDYTTSDCGFIDASGSEGGATLWSAFLQGAISLAVAMLGVAVLSAFRVAKAADGNPADRAQDTSQLEEVVVTGSRLVRPGLTTPTPVTAVGAEDVQARAAVTLSTILFELPSARPTSTAVASPFGSGGNFANLRNLGQTRTLVLVDGRRFVPTTVTGQVDTNVVPTALVERVEVITGGASAAWGSDAVAGVTNIILDKDIRGFRGNVQYGQTQRADNRSVNGSLAWGAPFAGGRGQLTLAGEYSKGTDPARLGNRDWGLHTGTIGSAVVNGTVYTSATLPNLTLSSLAPGGVIVGGTTTNAAGVTSGFNTVTVNATTGVRSFNALIAPANQAGIQFGQGSTVLPFQYGDNVSGTFMQGGGGPWLADQSPLATPVKRTNLFGRASFDITSSIRSFVEGSFIQSGSVIDAQPSYVPNGDAVLSIARDNAYVQTLAGLAPIRTLFQANPTLTTLTMGRINTEIGRLQYDSLTKVRRLTAGLSGQFAGDWHWDAYYSHGQTDYRAIIRNHIREANLRAAVDAVVDSTGNIVCRASTVATLQADAPCVPANPFGAGSLSQAAVNYVTGTEFYNVLYKQDAGGASLQGDPFSTWAGPVSTAAGIEYRKESLDVGADPVSVKSVPNTLYANLAGGGFQFSNPKPFGGSYSVSELFAEANVPLLAKLPGAQSLDLNGAVRSTDYSTSGKVTSWKYGATYRPISDLLFRATRSRDIRAPNLNELYVVGQIGVATANDFITGAAVSTQNIQSVTNGNTGLVPEYAATTTYGVTWTGSGIEGLSASLDVYKIDIRSVIATQGTQNVVNLCQGVQGFAQDLSYCSLITRANGSNGLGTTAITRIATPWQNLNAQSVNGLDVELNYRLRLSKLSENLPGTLTLRALGTHTKNLKTTTGATTTDAAGDSSTPLWLWTTSANYQQGPWTVYLQGRYVDAVKISNTNNVLRTTDILNNRLPSRTYANASVQYVLHESGRGRAVVYGSINNLFDKNPPLNTATQAQQLPAAGGYYDLLGRSFAAGMRFTF